MPRGPSSYYCAVGAGFVLRHALHNNVMNETTTKIFPYLERLLDGEEVEWKTLGEVCDILRGKRVTKKELSDEGEYAVFQNSMIPLGYYHQCNVSGDTTFVICAGSAGEIGYSKEDFWAADDVYYFACSDCLISKYVYYFLYTKQLQILQQVRKASIPRLSKRTLENLPIPIPPLRVQARIVEILDKFTQLEAELEAELVARRKQYAYYRDQLLNFSQYPPLNVNIEWKTLGEIMEIVTDFTAAGSFASNAQNVRYLQEPNYALLVRTTDIKQGFKATDKFVYVDQHAFEYLWRVNLDKECIILPNVGNCGEVYHSSPSILPYTKCVLGPNAILVRSEKVSNKFLFYLFQAAYFQKELAKITSTAGQGKFNKTNLKQIKLPIPPLFKQRRIVDIHDRFDTLTNSINEGLPKEIALRRKQYEYYRDALLSFPRAEVTA